MSHDRASELLEATGRQFRPPPVGTAGVAGGDARLTETGPDVLALHRRLEPAASAARPNELDRLTAPIAPA